VSHVSAIVRPDNRAYLEWGRRLGQFAVITLLAACGTRDGSAATVTASRATVAAVAPDRVTPAVVSVSAGASIEWGFAVATAGMRETHVRFAGTGAEAR
jgi:hypothetical protein